MKQLLAIVASVVIAFALASYADAQSQHWTYPGEIHDHLATGHGFNAAGMSRAQAEAEHDRLHNAERGTQCNYAPAYRSQPSGYARSYQPARSRGIMRGRWFRR